MKQEDEKLNHFIEIRRYCEKNSMLFIFTQGSLATGERETMSQNATSAWSYDRASNAAVITTASARSNERRGSQRAVLNTTCSPAVRWDSGITLTRLTRGPSTRSCSRVRTSNRATSVSFTMTIPGQEEGLATATPRSDNNIGPVITSIAMATQTMGRKRSAADRNNAINSGTAFRLLTNGAKTNDRKIMPPTQLIAARMCKTTSVEYILCSHD